MGFGTLQPDEGLAIAFGWNARGAIFHARKNGAAAGLALAKVISTLRLSAPERPVHVMAHSLGIEPVLEALHHLPVRSVDRILSLTGASHVSRVEAALETPAGRTCQFFNITSRENDAFDFLFERTAVSTLPGDQAIGAGVTAPNAVTLQLDCDQTLRHLARLGSAIAPARRRICHWSSYTRPGVMKFYSRLLRQPETLPLSRIRAGLPATTAPRWSRLLAVHSEGRYLSKTTRQAYEASVSLASSPYVLKRLLWVMKKMKIATVRPNVLK